MIDLVCLRLDGIVGGVGILCRMEYVVWCRKGYLVSIF